MRLKSERRKWAKARERERMMAEYESKGSPQGSAKPAKARIRKFGGRAKKNLMKRREAAARHLSPTEQWFYSLYQAAGFNHPADELNAKFCGFVPSVLNHDLKYAIEVHVPPAKGYRDRSKARAWSEKGYRVFAVWEWRDDSFERFRAAFDDFRRSIFYDRIMAADAKRRNYAPANRDRVEKPAPAPTAPSRPTVILRRAKES